MMAIKLDQVKYCNLVDTYVNYDTLIGDINISGSVASGATVTFSVSINYSRAKTRADIYLKNTTTGKKMTTSQGARIMPYIASGGEAASHTVSYSAGVITIVISIFNGTGSPISLISQTLQAQVVAYEVPYTT